MTLDERIQRLMELLSQVTLRPAATPTGSPPPVPEEADSAPAFDAEMTVVENDLPMPSAVAKPVPTPPESNAHESRSRLIAAARIDLDFDLEDDTKTSLERTQENPSFAGDEMDLATSESDESETSPGSTRRPVLPDDAAPALPDVEWEDTSHGSAPPESGPSESGPHFAALADEIESDVTGVRSASSLLLPAVRRTSSASMKSANVSSIAPSAKLSEDAPATFGELLDDALEL